MNNLFMGRDLKDWEDIYSLLVFLGDNPKSFSDLIAWQPPQEPAGCLSIGLALVEARMKKYDNPVRNWASNILTNHVKGE